MSSFLDKILDEKRRTVAAAKAALPQDELLRRLDRYFVTMNPDRDFCGRLKRAEREHIRVIGEIKRASPSKGLIAEFASPLEVARKFRQAGVSALSVVTDEPFFQGKLSYLDDLQTMGLPLLRKDFIVDEYQLYESILHGADAVLLIVAVLGPETIRLAKLAAQLDLEVLVEIHEAGELPIAVDSGAPAIGVNARDLKTFELDLARCEELLPRLPHDRVRVAESGVKSRLDAKRMQLAGADAVLVGEGLMRAEDPSAFIRMLKGETM
jgi:indole-3-glycerol phosphate synthase